MVGDKIMKEKKLRIAVVGVGYLGRFHAEKYARMDDVELVGVADVNKTQAEAVAKCVETRAYRDYRDLLGRVDAVSVVTPTALHHEVSRAFLQSDADVLIEKPVTATLGEAQELIELAESRGLLIQVGHLERFNPAVAALKEMMVHPPLFIESHRLSVFKNRCTDVSVVLDLMIHDIDIILNLVPFKIKRIQASGAPVVCPSVDIANARLEFANGCVANITASRISMKNERKIRFFQKDAYISVDFANREITRIAKDESAVDAVIPGMGVNRLCFTNADPLDDELKSFVRCVRHREVPEVTGQMGRDALKIALSIMDQIEASIRLFRRT